MKLYRKEKEEIDDLMLEDEIVEDGEGQQSEPFADFSDLSLTLTRKRRKKGDPIQPVEEERPETDIELGLTEEQVNAHVEKGWTNKVRIGSSKTVPQILISNIFTFFNLLCGAIFAILFAIGEYKDTFFIVIVFFNTLIGIIQELRAKATIDKLSLVSAPTGQVIRDGKLINVPTDDIVLDEMMVFTAGKQICADAILRDGDLEVNEALLTGESVPVRKHVGDKLYAGSFVVSGIGRAQAIRVGANNYVQMLASAAKRYQKPKSELLQTMTTIIKTVGIIIIPFAAMTFYTNIKALEFTEEIVRGAIIKTAASVIGMIPSGMFLLTSVALAVGVLRLAKNKTLVQELYCIEMLARVSVLCLDKTGTITDGTMTVSECVEIRNDSDHTVKEIVGSMLSVLNDNNQTSIALERFFGKNEILNSEKIYPFSSERKFSAVTFEDEGTYILGAPEFVYKDRNVKLETKINKFASMGFRVLMLANTSQAMRGETLPKVVRPVALIVIQDRIREDAPETIEYFRKNGVAIKVISGDNPLTVSEVARRAGVENADRYISLAGMSNRDVQKIANEYTVFGRVTPEQKKLLIKTFKQQGETVAMTGDGVNDILAMKEADCSIAMAAGSEAARNVSHLVLLDSNFSSMPKVVSEGRRVINNIQRTSALYLMKTIFTILISLMCIFWTKPYPFRTVQMMILEMFVIGFPSFVLALEPNNEKVNGSFIINILRVALPGALTVVLYIAVLFLIQPVFQLSEEELSTIALMLTVVVGFCVLYRVCAPFNALRGAVFFAMIAVAFCAVYFWPGITFFSFVTLNTEKALLLLAMAEMSYPIMSLLAKAFNAMKISKSIQF